MTRSGQFTWQRKQRAIEAEAAMDGIYVIRSSEPAKDLSADDAVRNYKRLGDVEQAFRTLKGLELLVRPIHHRVDDRVRAHLFVCLLAYYVQWHLKQAWASLLFTDEHPTLKNTLLWMATRSSSLIAAIARSQTGLFAIRNTS